MPDYPPGREAVRDHRVQIGEAEGKPLQGEIIPPPCPQDALRSPAEQYAALVGCSLAEAEAAMAPQLEGRPQSLAAEAAEWSAVLEAAAAGRTSASATDETGWSTVRGSAIGWWRKRRAYRARSMPAE